MAKKFLPPIFNSNDESLIGVEINAKYLQIDEKTIKLQIWRFDGNINRGKFLIPQYVQGAQGGIFMYDITNYSSLLHIDDWLALVRKGIDEEDFHIIVVGNKADLSNERKVSHQEGIKIAKSRDTDGFIECSVKTGENVEEIFEGLTRLMIDRY